MRSKEEIYWQIFLISATQKACDYDKEYAERLKGIKE